MPYKDITKARLTAYAPPYIKKALAKYVRHHPNMTVSRFIKEAINEKLVAVGAINPQTPKGA